MSKGNPNPVNAFGKGNNRGAKLTGQQVLALRQLYADGATQGSLARRYGISVNQIGRIVRGESWTQYQMIETRQEAEHHEAIDTMLARAPPQDDSAAVSLAKFAAMHPELMPAVEQVTAELGASAQQLTDESPPRDMLSKMLDEANRVRADRPASGEDLINELEKPD
jgi:hypothetical protein